MEPRPIAKPPADLVCKRCAHVVGTLSGDRRRARMQDGAIIWREATSGVVYMICPKCQTVFYLHGTVAVFVTVADRTPC